MTLPRMAEVPPARLTLERVERELPALDSPENVRGALQKIQQWACGGLLPGVTAGAAVRSCEVWLKVAEHETDMQRVRVLERRVRELEAELAARPGRAP